MRIGHCNDARLRLLHYKPLLECKTLPHGRPLRVAHLQREPLTFARWHSRAHGVALFLAKRGRLGLHAPLCVLHCEPLMERGPFLHGLAIRGTVR